MKVLDGGEQTEHFGFFSAGEIWDIWNALALS